MQLLRRVATEAEGKDFVASMNHFGNHIVRHVATLMAVKSSAEDTNNCRFHHLHNHRLYFCRRHITHYNHYHQLNIRDVSILPSVPRKAFCCCCYLLLLFHFAGAVLVDCAHGTWMTEVPDEAWHCVGRMIMVERGGSVGGSSVWIYKQHHAQE